MNIRERMLNGLPYKPGSDDITNQLVTERLENKKLLHKYNHLEPENIEERDRLIREILGSTGEKLKVNIPFFTDYGKNIHVGENFYTNFNCVILDTAPVIIGDNVMFGPNVAIYAANHPIHPDSRNSGYESGHKITIGDNVWLGGNVVVNPGVNIGNNVVVGSGSVVTCDLPNDVVAVGNPCRVIREITDEDRKYYYKDRVFDVEDY